MKTKILSKIYEIAALIFVFLAPIVFLPFFTDPYDFGRQVFVLVAAFIVFVLGAAKALMEKKISFRKNSYLLPLFLLFVVFTASALINTPNKLVSLASVLGPASFLLMLFTFFIVSNREGEVSRQRLVYALLGSAALLATVSLILFLGKFTFPLNFPSLNLSITKAWSPTGSLLSQVVFFGALVPLGFALVYEKVQKKNLLAATLTFLANVLILVGLGIGLYMLTNDAKPILLPQQTAWAIAAESIKNVRFALLGIGPGQFVNAFTAFKPLSFNATDMWNLRFGVSSNWYFQLLTEVGFLGLILYLILAVKILRNGFLALREPKISPLNLALYISLLLMLAVQFFIPINFSLLLVLAILLALAETGDKSSSFDLAGLGNMAGLLAIVPIIVFGVLFYFGGKIALANYYYLESIKAANQNDGIKTYNLQIKAIQTDPSVANYRVAYSQTNFALANSLAAKEDLTDNDKSTISQLIQQSLREAKAAVALDPSNTYVWENLSSLYYSLINFAEGADEWAISAYQQTINTDPLNPRLRVELGGLYYSQKNYNQAASLFLQAINLKSDMANAHYNLANSLRELGAFEDAKKEYEVTQTLVQADSADYQKVTSELEEVKKRLPAPTPTPAGGPTGTQTETLSTPEVPAQGIEPPLELPNEGPPITVTPSPISTTPEPSPLP